MDSTCVQNCPTNSDRQQNLVDLTLITYVTDDRREAWADEVRKINGPDWNPSESTTICRRHFLAKDFWQLGARRGFLLPGAVPHMVVLSPASEGEGFSSASVENFCP